MTLLAVVNLVVLGMALFVTIRAWLVLRRLILLDKALMDLVGAAFHAKVIGLPIWEAWAGALGDIEINVRSRRYSWKFDPTQHRSRKQ